MTGAVRGSVALLLVGVAGCTAAPHRDEAGCDAPVASEDGVVEVPADGGTVTGLLFGELPAEVGTDLKIVWRVTGSGDLTVRALRPDGSAADLAFGPEPHAASSFDAPGAEWGTGFDFDSAGCWRIELSRDGVQASLAVPVVPAGGGAGS